jgi:hypothetical protein
VSTATNMSLSPSASAPRPPVNTSYESTGSFPGVSTVRACGGILRCSGDGSEGSVGAEMVMSVAAVGGSASG